MLTGFSVNSHMPLMEALTITMTMRETRPRDLAPFPSLPPSLLSFKTTWKLCTSTFSNPSPCSKLGRSGDGQAYSNSTEKEVETSLPFNSFPFRPWLFNHLRAPTLIFGRKAGQQKASGRSFWKDTCLKES